MKNQRGFIGIDIGTHTIKIAQVENRSGEVVLMESAVVARRNPWSVNTWQKAVPMTSGDELMAALSLGQEFAGRKSASAASMALCDVRKMKVAVQDEKANRDQIRDRFREIERFSAEDRQFDYWPIHDQWKSRSEDNIYVLSMQNEWATQIATDQATNRLKCQQIDGIPMALARATELRFPSRDKEPVAILDWGYTRTTFCLELGGCPVFVRMLRDSGFKNTIHSICESLEVSTDEAMGLLREHGLALANGSGTEIQRAIAPIIIPTLGKVLDELQRTLQFLRSVRNVDNWLANKTQLDVKTWQVETPPDANTNSHSPVHLLGPAVALSALAWSQK